MSNRKPERPACLCHGEHRARSRAFVLRGAKVGFLLREMLEQNWFEQFRRTFFWSTCESNKNPKSCLVSIHKPCVTRGPKKSTAELLEPALLEHFPLGKSNLHSTEHRCSRASFAFSTAEACRPFGLSIASRTKSTAASVDENGKLESQGFKAFR